jgi:hypothetical protein
MKQAGLRLTTTIPDDTIEGEHDFERYGGKSDGDAVAELLKRAGYPVEEPEYLDFKGWEYLLEIKGRAYGYRSQRWPTWAFLVFFDHTWGLDRFFFRKAPDFARLLQQLNEALHADPRFTKVEWFENPGDALEEGTVGVDDPVVRTIR